MGELDTAAGNSEDAARHLNTSLALAEMCAAPCERALTLLALAELRAASGDLEAARAILANVRAICEPLRARPMLARVDALSARLTTAAPIRPPGALPGLTTREKEVLQLVAAGLTNAEIAARLFRSERTIEQHLHSIYRKLGSSSRTGATRFAVEHGFI
jgi:DNA-binding NarL/FixJ family response regulator